MQKVNIKISDKTFVHLKNYASKHNKSIEKVMSAIIENNLPNNAVDIQMKENDRELHFPETSKRLLAALEASAKNLGIEL